MVAIKDGSFTRFRCHTGHGFTAPVLSTRARENVENTLWSALAQLEEREVLLKEMEQTMRDHSGDAQAAEAYAAELNKARGFALRLRNLLKDPALWDESSARDDSRS
jgi:two-component system chemotaxis response regulator CheB